MSVNCGVGMPAKGRLFEVFIFDVFLSAKVLISFENQRKMLFYFVFCLFICTWKRLSWFVLFVAQFFIDTFVLGGIKREERSMAPLPKKGNRFPCLKQNYISHAVLLYVFS